MPTVVHRTLIRTTTEALFAFHAAPGAFERLTPPWEPVRVVARQGQGLDVGVRLTLEVKVVGPVRVRWEAEHVACQPPTLFKDVARSGPFRRWEHEHRFVPGEGGTWLEDHLEYELPLAPLSHLARPLVERRLRRMFEYRHRVTREALEAPAGSAS